MTKDSQPAPQSDASFIKEFSAIENSQTLRQYEKNNRERIASASLSIRDAFDRKWNEVNGKSYYLPVTEIPVSMPAFGKNDTTRSDPKSNGYTEKITFSEIHWQRLKARKIGRTMSSIWILKGIEKDTGKMRPIFQNLTIDRVSKILSQKDADDISSEKTVTHGVIKKEFTIDVEGYWLVQFAPKQSDFDTHDVELMWEGQALTIQRQTEVILPGFYLEVADNGIKEAYTETPKDGRKKVGDIQIYPYTVISRSSRQEYLDMKSMGDNIQREHLRRMALA